MASGGRCQVSVLFFCSSIVWEDEVRSFSLGFSFLVFQVLLFQVPGS